MVLASARGDNDEFTPPLAPGSEVRVVLRLAVDTEKNVPLSDGRNPTHGRSDRATSVMSDAPNPEWPATSPIVHHPLDSVTVDERRRALEAMAFDPDPSQRKLDPMILGSLGVAATEPAGDRFEGEGQTLAGIISAQCVDCAFETRTLAVAAIEVWSKATEGTAASRTALLRATTAFLLHHVASGLARSAKRESGTEHEQTPAPRRAPPGRGPERS
jgi:hypothetical protein